MVQACERIEQSKARKTRTRQRFLHPRSECKAIGAFPRAQKHQQKKFAPKMPCTPLSPPCGRPSGRKGVVQKLGDRHRSNASRQGGDGGLPGDLFDLSITHRPQAPGVARVRMREAVESPRKGHSNSGRQARETRADVSLEVGNRLWHAWHAAVPHGHRKNQSR